MAWLRSSPIATWTKSIFSPSATASGQRSKSAPIFSAVRSPPAVSSSGEVAGTVLGTVRKIESGACARVLQHRLDAGDVHDVADLVAVAEDRRGAVEQRRLGIGAGRHHARFDVDVRIDEAGREDAAAGVVDLGRAVPGRLVRAGRLDGGDASAGDPDLAAVEDALRIGRQQPRAGDDEVGRGARPEATSARRRVMVESGATEKRVSELFPFSLAAASNAVVRSMIVRNAGHCHEAREAARKRRIQRRSAG